MATLQSPLSFNNSGNQPAIPQQNTENIDPTPVKSFINPGFFTGGNTNMIDDVIGAENFEPPKKKGRGRPKGSRNKKPENSENITVLNDGSALVLADDGSAKANMVQTNTPYLESFKETNNLLKQELNRLDMLQNNIMIDLEYVRGSKTIKKKFDYVSMLGSTLGAISSNKVTVIKEMNKTILDCHNLDLKRAKDLKLNETKDDNKTIMDMYTAFVNTPVGTYVPGTPPPISNLDLTMPTGTEGLVRTEIPSDTPQQQNGITSAQNMMILGNDPNIQTVVVLDDSTGNFWFDVYNTSTMQPVPNTEKPDPMFLEYISIAKYNKVARNSNLDLNYPLIIVNNVGSNSIISEY